MSRRKFRRRFNRTGTVTKLSGKRRKPWLARGWTIDTHGTKRQPTIGTYETEKEAIRALEEWNVLNTQNKGSITFRQVYEEVYEEKVADGLTPSGLQSVRSSFKHWTPLHERVFAELTVEDYQKLIDERLKSDTPPSRSVLTKDRSLVRHMYDHQKGKGVDLINFAQFIKLRDAGQKKIRAYTDLELERIRKHEESPEHRDTVAACMILAYTGLRINEFLNLKKSDIHLDDEFLYTDGSKTESGLSRKIPIHPFIRPYLERLMDTEAEYVFSRKGKKVSDNYYRKNYHRPLMSLLDLDLTPHSFRHTAATKFRMAGMGKRAIADILGHKTTKVTDDSYVDLPLEYLVSEVKKIS